jgi:hypothetical protein
MHYVAVLIDPKDSDNPEVFGPHGRRASAVWHVEDVLSARFPGDWADTFSLVPDPADATADEVLNAWNEVAARTNYLPIIRVVPLMLRNYP